VKGQFEDRFDERFGESLSKGLLKAWREFGGETQITDSLVVKCRVAAF
jgi:hypothetical protein